jgi:hypothetical protein
LDLHRLCVRQQVSVLLVLQVLERQVQRARQLSPAPQLSPAQALRRDRDRPPPSRPL